LKELAESNPNEYFKIHPNSNQIEYINSQSPLVLQETLTSQGAVYNLALSPDNKILASCTNLGVITLWDTRNWTQIGELRDEKVLIGY
jgi:WD40 repeat protein